LLPAGLLLASGLLVACSGLLSDPAPQVETAALHDAAGDAVIATLHTKDSELKILSSGGRVRYSLLGADGASRSLTLEELQSYDPKLYEFVKSATARHGSPVLDARVTPSRAPSPPGAERVGAERLRIAPPAR
jgi:hypothetical protein